MATQAHRKRLLAGAAACAIAFGALLVLAYYVAPARDLDARALVGFEALQRPKLNELAVTLSGLCDPFPYVLFVAALIAVAAKTRGPRTALAAAVLLIGANVSSQLLKPVLAHHRELWDTWHVYNIQDAAFPSGHATAAMALGLAFTMVATPRFKPAAAATAALFVIAVSFSILTLNAHFPSDVVGGFLLASGWHLLAKAAVSPQRERPTDVRPVVATVALTGALLASAGMAYSPGFADRHTGFVLVAAAIGAAATALLAANTRNA